MVQLANGSYLKIQFIIEQVIKLVLYVAKIDGASDITLDEELYMPIIMS